ncbi:hypothetical protein [Persephonella sp.]
MRHRKRNLLAAALLAVAVSSPSFAQPEAVSDEALEEVSGQGLQIVENHNATFDNRGPLNSQNNNLDSVQVNDTAMVGTTVQYGGVLANSAVNTTSNYLYDALTPPPPPPPDGNKIFSKSFVQENYNEAVNHYNDANNSNFEEEIAIAGNLNKETQRVNTVPEADLPVEIVNQDNNNNSVQLNESAQAGSSGILLTNAAASAVNSADNYFVANGVNSTAGVQINNQKAVNFGNYAEASGVESVAAAFNAESDATQMINNGGTLLAHTDTKTENVIINDQDNNNNSVQLNDFAQTGVEYMTLKNIANSSANNGVNVVHVTGDVKESSISQRNSQKAENHTNWAGAETAIAANINKERQIVDNGHYVGDRAPDDPKAQIIDQDNNNNSVQMNDHAQEGASALILENVAISAVNTGINLMHIGGNTENSELTQENIQEAYNFNNTARGDLTAGAGNAELGTTQDINNYWTEVQKQDNNNNSVQLNNNAQGGVIGMVVKNAANSASNTGINILSGGEVGDLYTPSGDFSQSLVQRNVQTAENHRNEASANYEEGIAVAANINKQTQVIRNFTTDDPPDFIYIYDQDNNNNSVQLNDFAQSGANTVILSNTALSATNTAFNLMNAGNITNSNIAQTNTQTASNFNNYATGSTALAGNVELTGSEFYKTGEMEVGQMIENIHAVIPEGMEQNNNNNSVQLNDNAQTGVNSVVVANIANSAANIGFNMMNTGDITDSTVGQYNQQVAENHVNYADASDFAFAGNINKQKQYIYNCNCSSIDGEQNNNMNSVQLNDNAQSGMNTLVLLNSAGSATNIGVNMLNAGTVSGSSIVQVNRSTAENFTNRASGNTAIAGNGDFGVGITFPTLP